jgi:hypothetical protein
MGWGLSWLALSSPVPKMGMPLVSQAQPRSQILFTPDGAIDRVPDNLKLAESTYLETCATCHIGVSPAVFPTETWKALLLDPNHYGVTISLVDPFRRLIWNYLQAFSRSQGEVESVPFRLSQSRFFKALHPNVKLPETINLKGCVSCHPGVEQYHYQNYKTES